MRPFRHTFTRAWPRRSMWLRATSPTKASSTRLALRCISRPATNTARTLLKLVASYSSSGLNDPRKRLPISATSSSPKRQLSENAHGPHLAGYNASDFAGYARPEYSCRSAHGLRKAFLRRMAEAGCSEDFREGEEESALVRVMRV